MSGLHFSDYQRPVLLQQSDYRSATARSHHFKTASDRNFIEKSSRTLCDLFSYGAQPLKNLLVSESKDQLRYKVRKFYSNWKLDNLNIHLRSIQEEMTDKSWLKI